MGRFRVGGVCLLVSWFAATSSHAEPLDLSLELPDIQSAFIQVDYDESLDLFSAYGFALTIDYDGVPPPDFAIFGGVFDLVAMIDADGNATSGSLTITGEVNGAGPTLLTGDLLDFGFIESPGGDIFEFLFDPIGGDLLADFTPGPIGVILDAVDSGFDGTWFDDFSNGGFGNSDTAPIPEPTTLSLALGLLVCLARRR